MNNRSEVLAQVDQALDQIRSLDNEAAKELLRQRLNELFKPFDDLYDPPWVAFHLIFAGRGGALTAVVEPLLIQEDIFGWCRSIEQYLGGRLSIEPHEELDIRDLMAMSAPEA